ncbi:hypothetical protein M2451_003294 [Dysgonomonas sp. PFB1-18]|uniref:N-acetylmuramoyl-L-alanine amidase-like domain-containing protein n=1 Tax=unclassified Dysgonomonas TaxID=2630389 RepID=UPI002475B744|nr:MULTISPECIES: N-acetylmuramoyl-L-alanine amidase-like domain-containing protein [unclassified Dysgonomonas]MDH6310408.1 hypothetical protein [Dysgonomonas sp. PF1-14]MDH6340262.1 hypothetical protein [Dysgonomonas sp. PF1-16]MDH6381957.1 hypothetical protein [Dysgonomonas sp. PFB1-18]MDH6399234.1 hypothetical protein [Dysgonomonas sp. PF1-23]
MKPLFVLILLFCSLFCAAQGADVVYSKQDSVIYEKYIKEFKSERDKPLDELIVNTSKFFMGKPYVASTLEVSDKEQLIINLREFDCTTLVENSIALAKTIKSGDTSFGNYCRILKQIRYRDGEINGYLSRLHYTTDWIFENEKQNVFENISLKPGGKKVVQPVNFMSTHPNLYKHLKNSPSNIRELSNIEKEINKRDSYRIIPLAKIAAIEKGIENGNIITFATSIAGLDYSHMGIAYRQNGTMHFIHASSRAKQVVIETKTLLNYCKSSKNCTGISIFRIKPENRYGE